MDKRIMMGLLSISAALILVGGSAFAAFTAQAVTTANTFSTSNPSLKVNTGSGFSESESGFTESGIVPGGTPVNHDFTLWNTNTDIDATMVLSGQFVNLTAGSTLPPEDLNVNITCSNGANITKSVADWNLSAWGLGTLAPNATTTCTMSASLPSGNTTDANKTITFDVNFNASVGL